MSNLPVTWRAALGRDNDDTRGVYKFGYNPDVGATEETVWTLGGIYAYPASASVMKVSSSSTDDAVAGTGALTVTVYGLDASYNEQSESVILTGQTAAVTDGTYIRVFRVTVDTAGSGGVNAGILYVGTGTVTTGVPAVKHASVAIGDNQTLMCVYTVPAGYKALVVGVHIGSAANQIVTARVVARPFGGVFNTKEKLLVFRGLDNLDHTVPTVLDEKTDVEVRASGTASDVSASLEIILVRK